LLDETFNGPRLEIAGQWNEESAYLNSQPGVLDSSIIKSKSNSTKPPRSDASDFNQAAL